MSRLFILIEATVGNAGSLPPAITVAPTLKRQLDHSFLVATRRVWVQVQSASLGLREFNQIEPIYRIAKTWIDIVRVEQDIFRHQRSIPELFPIQDRSDTKAAMDAGNRVRERAERAKLAHRNGIAPARPALSKLQLSINLRSKFGRQGFIVQEIGLTEL